MADWRRLCKAALLADGGIDAKETEVLRKEFFADKRIDKHELEFLLEVQKEARSVDASFEKFVFEAVRSNILTDDTISADEAAWLRKWIFADGKVSDAEKKLLKELKFLAKNACKEFNDLHDQCMKA